MPSSRARSHSIPTHAGRYAKPTILDVSDERMEDEEALMIYRWLDSIEFTRSKKTAANRDFSDGVMMAELIAHYIPKIINSTFYIPTSATSKKIDNWNHLNKKVLKRIGFQFTLELIKDLASARSGVIERVLQMLQPSLLQGPRAVIPLLKKLDNVKSRFMDFDSYFQRKQIKRPCTAASSSAREYPTPTSRPQTSGDKSPGSLHQRSQVRTIFRGDADGSAVPNKVEEGVHEIPDLDMPIADESANYDLFIRPSTGMSTCSGVSSPSVLLDENNNPIEPSTEYQEGETSRSMLVPHVATKKQGFPSRSSWLPVSQEGSTLPSPRNKNDSAKVLNAGDNEPDEGNEYKNPSSTPASNENADQDVDGEIYCDHSGYDEDTEDNGGVTDEEDDSDCCPSAGDTPVTPNSKAKRHKRRLKRVVKYEYREEYILNGMANYQLPSNRELENIRKNYMNSGNNDPNCRGYGFV